MTGDVSDWAGPPVVGPGGLALLIAEAGSAANARARFALAAWASSAGDNRREGGVPRVCSRRRDAIGKADFCRGTEPAGGRDSN